MITPRLLTIAASVICKVDRQHPADQVLRAMLKGARQTGRDENAEIARAVFDFYRWRGWLKESLPLPEQIGLADGLAERFARDPRSFSNGELQARAIPAWTKEEVTCDPAWVRSLQTEPSLWLRARKGRGQALAAKLGHCRLNGTGLMGDTLEYQGDEDLFRTAEFHAGEFELQDLSSQVVGLICAPRPAETWWDACAGEGGKTLHLSDLMDNQGLIWATDRSARRLQILKRRAARARVFNYRTALWQDGAKPPIKTRFDGVLVDAPCSGLGTWQRNPHARWTTTPQDVRELAAVQQNLLARTAPAVKPGGRLVYSICTLTRSETAAVADQFEHDFPDFQPAAVRNPLRPKADPTGRIVLWPQDFGGNGMFLAVWKRTDAPESTAAGRIREP